MAVSASEMAPKTVAAKASFSCIHFARTMLQG
jgi:hypothetical protein